MPVPLLKLCPPAEALTADSDLLARFVATRDEVAFTELVRRHGPVVYRMCRRLVPAHAEDAFQAVFLILACRVAAVRSPAAIGSWLVGVAGRVACQMRKAERRRTECERNAGREQIHIESTRDAGELAGVLDDELAGLPDDLRDPLVLCLISERTHEQAASALGTSVRTVRRRLDRARTVLRARLERRGVVPALVTALIAGVREATGAVPHPLIRQTTSVVFQFLDDGTTVTAAVVVAKGVMQGMAKLKMSALIATAAALVCLGVAWSQDQPTPSAPPAQAGPNHSVELPLARAPGVPSAGPEHIPPRDVTATEAKTANFVVHAPTPMMGRVIAAEAEYHRRAIALKWLGKELPPWAKPCVIRFIQDDKIGGATVFTFGKDKGGEPAMATAEMEIRGAFLPTLASTLPHEVTHTVLASHLGRPVPRWADEGTAVMSESDDEQVNHDVRARELLSAGRAIRLKVLFRLTEYPRDMIVLFAQGHSVARFLAGRSTPSAALPGADGHRRLVAFLQLGSESNTAESWDKAAKTVFGFDTIDALEEAWLEWLTKPESALTRKEVAARPAPPVKPGGDLIPPVHIPPVPVRP